MGRKLYSTCPLISHGSAVPASPQGEAFGNPYKPQFDYILFPVRIQLSHTRGLDFSDLPAYN